MKLLDRYLLRELMVPLAVCLVGITVFFIAFELIAGLNRFQEHHLNVKDVLDIYLVKTPEILVFILPISLLLALLKAITNHARHNEITAIRAAGVSLWRIILPYLAVGLFCSFAVLFMNEEWVPESKSNQMEIMSRHTRDETAVQPNLRYNFFYPGFQDNRKWVVTLFDTKSGILHNPIVYWRENGRDWTLIAHRAEYIDGKWTFYGTNHVGPGDIANLPQLAAALQKPDNNFTEYVRTNLTPATSTLLAKYTGGENPELRKALAMDLNHFLFNGSLYDTKLFYGIKLSPDVVNLIARNAEGTDAVELNYLLLADAFPSLSCRKSAYSVKVYRDKSELHSNDIPVLYTNRLVMPQFGESLDDFVTEAKFNDRFINLNPMESIEIPIYELHHYLSSHPMLSGKPLAQLETQMHERIAMPWTCLVVVLISVPFGAAGGRRNIFKGVAGSIFICFSYYVLVRICLALGSAGWMPAWLAAWLPNGLFGCIGCMLISKVD